MQYEIFHHAWHVDHRSILSTFAQHLRCCCDQEKQMKLAGTKPTAAAQSQPTTKEPFSFDDGLCLWSFICLPHLFSVLALSMQLPQLLELPSIHTIHLSSSYITLKYTSSSSFQYTSKLNSQCFTNILICLFMYFSLYPWTEEVHAVLWNSDTCHIFQPANTYVCVRSTVQQQPSFYGHYTGQPALAVTSS